MRYQGIIFWCLVVLLAHAGALSGAERLAEFLQHVDQPFGGSQSPDEARLAGIAKGKADALERAGTFLESYSLVENFVLKKDESLALTAGVLKTEVVDQQNYATDVGFGMRLTLLVSVDKSILEKRLEQIKTDRALMRKYQELQTREATLLARIRELEARGGSGRGNSVTSFAAAEKYRSTVQGLPAMELNRKALELWSKGEFRDPRAALDLLDQALTLDPDNTITINNRGVALYQLGRRREAMEAFEQATGLDPGYSDGYSNQGVVHMAEQDYLLAELAFTRVIELVPMRIDAYINRGVARKNLWRFEAALEDYQRVLAIDPELVGREDSSTSAALNFNELSRICEKATRACGLGLCRGLNYLEKKQLCTR